MVRKPYTIPDPPLPGKTLARKTQGQDFWAACLQSGRLALDHSAFHSPPNRRRIADQGYLEWNGFRNEDGAGLGGSPQR